MDRNSKDHSKMSESDCDVSDMMESMKGVDIGAILSDSGFMSVVRKLQEEEKELGHGPYYYEIIDFNISQIMNQAATLYKIPVANIPMSSPGLDILCFCLWSEVSEMTLTAMSEKTTFPQIFLNADLLALAHTGYMAYCNKEAPSKQNPDKSEHATVTAEDREKNFKSLAEDKYKFISCDMKELNPMDADMGYSAEEVLAYLLHVAWYPKKLEDGLANIPDFSTLAYSSQEVKKKVEDVWELWFGERKAIKYPSVKAAVGV